MLPGSVLAEQSHACIWHTYVAVAFMFGPTSPCLHLPQQAGGAKDAGHQAVRSDWWPGATECVFVQLYVKVQPAPLGGGKGQV